jgi:hypothetical protein
VSVAGDSSAGYLVVWQDSRWTGNVEQGDIYATLVSPAGEVSHPQGVAVSTVSGHQTRPVVAADGSDFLVVWQDSRAMQGAIYASRVSRVGVVLDPEGVLVDPGDEARSPNVAAYSDGFLVVWDRTWDLTTSSIMGARLNQRAEMVDTEAILFTATDSSEGIPAVASNGAAWLVVWQDSRTLTNGSDIYGVRIGYDGTVLDLAAIAISTEPGPEQHPAVANAGGDYLVVWTDYRNSLPSFTDVYGTRVRGDGNVLDTRGIAICTAPDFQYNPAVTSDGTNYFVVWQDRRNFEANTDDVYAARVSRAGVVLERNGFPVSTDADGEVTPAAAFNGQNFLVVWAESTQQPRPHADIWGAQVSTGGVVLDPAGIPISRATNAQNGPVVASAGSEFLVIWSDTRDTVTSGGHTFGGHLYGARFGSDGNVVDPDGFLISTEAFSAVPALAFGGTDFLVVWGGSGATAGPTRQIRAAWIEPGGRVLLRDLTINPTAGGNAVAASGSSNTFLVISEGSRHGASRVVGNLVSLASTPFIKSLTLADSSAALSWRAEAGKTYRVQFKPGLRDTNWLDLNPVVTATNTVASILDPTIAQDAQRFYRVVQLP